MRRSLETKNLVTVSSRTAGMIQPLRRSLVSPLRFSSPLFLLPFERRCFSHIRPQWDAPRSPQPSRASQPPDRSIRLAAQGQMVIPSDVGLLEGTFVNPSRKNLPSIFKDPRQLVKLHWARIRSRIRDRLSLLVLKWSSPKQTHWYKRTVKLHRGQIAPTAVALHRQMYSAFAEGDSDTLRKLCADGIYESFKTRIAARPRGETVRWEVVKYNRRAKVVSNRAAKLPLEGSMITQAVVRIDSRQRLTRYKSNGSVIPGTGKEKSIVEYLVLQKMYRQWRGGDWHVWGTIEETKLEDLERWANKHLD